MKCVDCVEHKRCGDSFISWIFFLIGLVATIAIRLVTLLVNIEPFYGKIAWYVGVTGFLLFFVYKFRVNQTRYGLIEQNGLIDKVSRKNLLRKEDYDLIGAILCSLGSKKERINYFFIFALSAIALILAVYFDFIK